MTTTTGRRSLRIRLLVALVVAALAATTHLATAAPPAAAATVTTGSTGALDWLARELQTNDHRLPSAYDPTVTDWGLTIDAVLALQAGGRGTSPAATASLDAISAGVTSYVTGADFGAPADRYAGPIGKALLVQAVAGRDVGDVSGFDLEAASRAAMKTTGSEAGRFSDVSAWGDFSNGFGQALNILGLARTTGGVPAPAVTFLQAQQCPGGGFRLYYDVTGGCTSDVDADPDATALAVQALLTQPPSIGVGTSVQRAVAYLTGIQGATGGIGGAGPTAAANSISTGQAAAALVSAKHPAPARRAATWIGTVQLTTANAGGAAADAGAIANDPATLAAAQTAGIDAASRDQWRRSTAQAVLGLGLPSYDQIGRPAAWSWAWLSSFFVTTGQSVTLTATELARGERVEVSLNFDPTVVATGTVDATGTLTLTTPVPQGWWGLNFLVVKGTTSERTAVALFFSFG